MTAPPFLTVTGKIITLKVKTQLSLTTKGFQFGKEAKPDSLTQLLKHESRVNSCRSSDSNMKGALHLLHPPYNIQCGMLSCQADRNISLNMKWNYIAGCMHQHPTS